MQGATFDEFKAMLVQAWEIDYLFCGHEFHYQRNGFGDGFEVYLTRDGEYVYQGSGRDMGRIADEVLALPIYDGSTLEDAEDRVQVVFEA